MFTDSIIVYYTSVFQPWGCDPNGTVATYSRDPQPPILWESINNYRQDKLETQKRFARIILGHSLSACSRVTIGAKRDIRYAHIIQLRASEGNFIRGTKFIWVPLPRRKGRVKLCRGRVATGIIWIGVEGEETGKVMVVTAPKVYRSQVYLPMQHK